MKTLQITGFSDAVSAGVFAAAVVIVWLINPKAGAILGFAVLLMLLLNWWPTIAGYLNRR